MKKRLIEYFFLILTFVSCFFIIYSLFYPINKSVKSDEFIKIANKFKCTVKNNNLNYDTKYYEYYSTETSTCPYTIHYITASNEKEAKNIFTDFIEDVYNNENVTGKSNISINLFTDYYDNETSGDYFKSITKQNNKLLYIKCEKKYREKALSIKKETGFYYQTRWTNVFLFIIPIITNSIHESLKMKNNKKQV